MVSFLLLDWRHVHLVHKFHARAISRVNGLPLLNYGVITTDGFEMEGNGACTKVMMLTVMIVVFQCVVDTGESETVPRNVGLIK